MRRDPLNELIATARVPSQALPGSQQSARPEQWRGSPPKRPANEAPRQ